MSIATLILIFAALFEAHNFGMFGGHILGLEQGHISVGGMTIGLAVSLAAAANSSARNDANRKRKLKDGSKSKAGRQGDQMDWGLIMLFLISGIVISPVIFLFLGDEFFSKTLRWVVSITYAIAPSAVMFAVGAANGAKGVLRLDTELTISLQWLTDWLIDRFTQSKKEDVKPAKVVTQKSKVDTKVKPKKEKKKLTDEMLIKNIKKYPDWTQQQRADHFGFSRNTINQRMGGVSK